MWPTVGHHLVMQPWFKEKEGGRVAGGKSTEGKVYDM